MESKVGSAHVTTSAFSICLALPGFSQTHPCLYMTDGTAHIKLLCANAHPDPKETHVMEGCRQEGLAEMNSTLRSLFLVETGHLVNV